jgi:hypothetical protein
VIAEVGAVQEQVVHLHATEVAGGEGVELLLDRLADPAHRRLAESRLGPERLGQRRLHIPHRQATDKAGQHQGLRRVGAADALAQQPGHERLGGARSFGAFQHDRAGDRLDLDRLMAVAVPRTRVGITLITVPTKELADLGFQRGLDHQTHAEPGDLLQRLGQRLATSEQLVDLGADALGGR